MTISSSTIDEIVNLIRYYAQLVSSGLGIEVPTKARQSMIKTKVFSKKITFRWLKA